MNIPDSIGNEIIHRVHHLITDQARFIYPAEYAEHDEEMFNFALNTITIEEAGYFLQGSPIVSADNLLDFVSKIGVKALFDEGDWTPGVTEYIINHSKSCRLLWDFLERNCTK